MKLAKPRIDIGFATNDAPAALAFWQNRIGLPFDYTQPIRRGYKQHRHDLCGSILKINQVYDPLPDAPPAGCPRIADRARRRRRRRCRSSIPTATASRWCRGASRDRAYRNPPRRPRRRRDRRRFYMEALGLPQGDANGPGETYLAGDTVLIVEPDPGAPA